MDQFAQLLWRPRPPTLLSAQKLQEIKKNLKSYYPQFESKDRMRQSKASKELIEKRAALMNKFNEYRNKRIKEWYEQKPRRQALRNSKSWNISFESYMKFCFFLDIDTDELDSDTKNLEEEIVEFFIKEEETVIN